MKTMKTLFVVLVLVGLSAGALAQPNTTTQKLEAALISLLKLQTQLPWSGIEAAQRDSLKNQWRTMTTQFESTIDQLDIALPGKSAQDLRDLVLRLRYLGLVLPFADSSHRDSLIRDYLSVIDTVRDAVEVVAKLEPTMLWKFKGLVWKKLDGKMGFRAATTACESLLIAGTVGWHVPTAEDFGTLDKNAKNMKDPVLNPVFAKDVANWKDAWSSTKTNSGTGGVGILNIDTWNLEDRGLLTPANVVCVGRPS